jgi:hypothetical protein
LTLVSGEGSGTGAGVELADEAISVEGANAGDVFPAGVPAFGSATALAGKAGAWAEIWQIEAARTAIKINAPAGVPNGFLILPPSGWALYYRQIGCHSPDFGTFPALQASTPSPGQHFGK